MIFSGSVRGHITDNLGRLVLLCMLFVGQLAVSQPADTLKFEQRFAFSPYSNPKTDVVNHFLQKIAEGNGRLRAYTAYTFSGELTSVYSLNQERQCELSLLLARFGFLGDVHYRDFSLEKMLIPDLISFRLQAIDVNGAIVFDRFFEDLAFSDLQSQAIRLSIPDMCRSNKLSIQISALQFYYSEQIHDRFDAWLGALESYYTSYEILDELSEALPQISFDDPETLLLEEFRLCEIEQKLAYVKYADFHAWVDLTLGDPDTLLPRYLAFSMQTDALRSSFNRAISRIDTLYYEKAVGIVDDAYEAQRLHRLSLTYNPFHIPSNLAVAAYDLSRHHIAESLNRLAHVHAVMLPTGIWAAHADTLTKEVFNTSFEEVRELIADGRFLDALEMLADVARFCETTFGRYDCPGDLFLLQSESHKGMFKSFVRVSERAFMNGNLTLCMTYLESAIDYHRTHAAFIFDRREAVDLLQKLVDRYWELGEQQYAAGNLLDAAATFLRAREICSKYPFVTCK